MACPAAQADLKSKESDELGTWHLGSANLAADEGQPTMPPIRKPKSWRLILLNKKASKKSDQFKSSGVIE